jgi:hypothetical protein
MRVRLRRGMLNCSVRPWVPGSTPHRLSTIGADDQASLVAHPRGEYVSAFERGRGDAYVRQHVVHGQSDGWRHVDRGAPAMRVAGFCGAVFDAGSTGQNLPQLRCPFRDLSIGATELRDLEAAYNEGLNAIRDLPEAA